MKKFLVLFGVLAMTFGLLAACDNNEEILSDSPGDGLHQRDYEYSADWPENDFTKQLPNPPFSTTTAEPNDTVYSVVCEATVVQLKEYVETLKEAGFTVDASTEEENAFSVHAYSYTASNENGYTVEVNYSNVLGSLSTLSIKKSA